MKSLDNISEDLFNKIRGRFPSVTIGDGEGKITTDPLSARFFDFDFTQGGNTLGKVSVSVSEEKISITYSDDLVENADEVTKNHWYDFLREIRMFAKKRLLQFDTRNITKSNLDKRDYAFLAQQQGGDTMMSESKLYGTSRISYQDIGKARLNIRHSQAVNPERRTQYVERIYVESPEGERFLYPYRHINGARAMARHISEGGKPFDDFGKHITGLSEELAKLRKFKTYMGRSSVMAESLAEYVDAVSERIEGVKNEIARIQKPTYYTEAVEGFEAPVLEDVPEDVAENWIEQLTIKQFNEELKDVFPFVYKVVSEYTKAKELNPEDLEEGFWGRLTANSIEDWAAEDMGALTQASKDFMHLRQEYQGTEFEAQIECRIKHFEDFVSIKERMPQDENGQPLTIDDPESWAMNNPNHKCATAGQQESLDPIESTFEQMMGQFSDKVTNESQEPQIPLSEFILSLFDRENGQFPKGETAVLTAVEKGYGEQYINPAKAFIEAISNKVAEIRGFKEPELADNVEEIEPVVSQEENDIKRLAGL